MHVLPQTLLVPLQAQVPPGPLQTWPVMAEQSLVVQQVPSLMQVPDAEQKCFPDGHPQLPPMPLQISPDPDGQSASMQQVPLVMQTRYVLHTRCPLGHPQEPAVQTSPLM